MEQLSILQHNENNFSASRSNITGPACSCKSGLFLVYLQIFVFTEPTTRDLNNRKKIASFLLFVDITSALLSSKLPCEAREDASNTKMD